MTLDKITNMENNVFLPVTDRIRQVVEAEEAFLLSLDQETVSERFNRQNRSVRQILGHLVDSASNNHQRIVRLQYNRELVFPDYRQDNDLWIALQDYQHADWNTLVQLWKFYNLHMVQVIGAVDLEKLDNYWYDFEGTKVTLREMIEGYPVHLDLHIGEIHELCRSF